MRGESGGIGEMRRTVTVGDASVTIKEFVSIHGLSDRQTKHSKLVRCRRVTGTHMASSRYFQPVELMPGQFPWTSIVEMPASEPIESTIDVTTTVASGPASLD